MGTIIPLRGRGRDQTNARSGHSVPSPAKVFAAWVLSLPKEADFGEAARQQIALIDRHASTDPEVYFLRTLLMAVAGEGATRNPGQSF